MAKYTPEEEKELNTTLRMWQRKASNLVANDYYDAIADDLSENTIDILRQIINASSHKDINITLWNSGLIESTLERVAAKIKKVKKDNRGRK